MNSAANSLPDVSTELPRPTRFVRPRRAKGRTSLVAFGLPMIWSNGGALVVALVMIVGLLVLVFYQGTSTFWPVPLV